MHPSILQILSVSLLFLFALQLKSEILKKNDMINSMKRELSNINKRLEDEEKIDEISEGIVENALAEEKEKGIDTVN